MIRLNDYDLKLLEKVRQKTRQKINVFYMKEPEKETLIEDKEIINVIEDLLDAYESLEDKFRDYVRDVDDNYKQIKVSEQYE